MRKISILLLAGACALGAAAQTTTKMTAAKANDYGLVYCLPTTVLDITIETEMTEKKPGQFYNYARRNLGIEDAILQESYDARVKSVTIVPRGEANKDNEWLMSFKGGVGTYVILNGDNVPVAINTEDIPAQKAVELPKAKAAEPTPLETDAARQAITQDMTMSSSQAKQAQLATERIFELRESRNDLISGQADNMPPDGKALQLALDNLSAQEAALTAMFAGTTKTWTEVNTLVYTPGDENVKNFVLARLSPIDGLVDASDLSGTPIYLNMEILSKGEIPTDEKGREKAFPSGGVAYQIPGTAQFSINYNGSTVKSDQVTLAQLGVTYGLDPKIFIDKKAPAFVLLNPTTGAITTLGIKE